MINLHCLSGSFMIFVILVGRIFGKHEEVFSCWKCVYSFGICVRLYNCYCLAFIGLHDYCIFCYKLLLVTMYI